ncbi:MAG TPA: phosphatidate cytidylyltransferase [Bacteroidia bacterium]|nr:phosphatidate cytidylyltransferase [Bacteroidia bacterium]
MSNLLQRTITGIIFIAVVIGSIVLSPLAFCILFLFITLLSVLEFYKMVSAEEIKPQIIFGAIIASLIFIYFSYLKQTVYRLDWASDLAITFKIPALIALLYFMIFIFELFRKSQRPFINIALTITGIIYVAVPFSLFISIGVNSDADGNYQPHIALGYLFLLWANDTGAYVFGSKFGKHRLFERISPKKTWEGSIGGAASALLIAYIISLFYTDLQLKDWMVMALIIVIAGTLGDLVESMLKRSLNIKDSGSIFPGHGGMLDRFDGLLLSAPFVFFYLFLFEKI